MHDKGMMKERKDRVCVCVCVCAKQFEAGPCENKSTVCAGHYGGEDPKSRRKCTSPLTTSLCARRIWSSCLAKFGRAPAAVQETMLTLPRALQSSFSSRQATRRPSASPAGEHHLEQVPSGRQAALRASDRIARRRCWARKADRHGFAPLCHPRCVVVCVCVCECV
jgi:hypothetical protein